MLVSLFESYAKQLLLEGDDKNFLRWAERASLMLRLLDEMLLLWSSIYKSGLGFLGEISFSFCFFKSLGFPINASFTCNFLGDTLVKFSAFSYGAITWDKWTCIFYFFGELIFLGELKIVNLTLFVLTSATGGAVGC